MDHEALATLGGRNLLARYGTEFVIVFVGVWLSFLAEA